jgi:MFS family permease
MCVPVLMYFLDRTTCMMLMLFLLFMYSTLRGISICGFLPWITQLVPEKIRGTYISKDQMFSALASLFTMIGVAALFYPKQSRHAFAIAFLVSFVAGIFSLFFLKKMPDVPVPPSSQSQEKVPWLKMLFYPPFFKLMRYNLVMNSAFAAAGVFWMSVLREDFHWSSSEILQMAAGSTFTAIVTLWFFGKMIDRVGSLPLLNFAGLVVIFNFLTWFLAASHLLPFHHLLIVLSVVSGGIGGPLFNLANTRSVMATVPEMGRSHFFALYSVLNSLTLGILPIVWGIILDGLRTFHWHCGRFDLDNYTLLYFWLILTILAGFRLLAALSESRALSNEEFFRELLVDTPSRAITRLLPRRPFFQ